MQIAAMPPITDGVSYKQIYKLQPGCLRRSGENERILNARETVTYSIYNVFIFTCGEGGWVQTSSL